MAAGNVRMQSQTDTRREREHFINMKKADWILIVTVIVLAALLWLIFYRAPAPAMRAEITVDGVLIRSEPMAADRVTIVVENEYGRNDVVVNRDTVEVVWADCASQVCVRTGKISRPGEKIVCLPHRLVVTIKKGDGEEDALGEVDAVASADMRRNRDDGANDTQEGFDAVASAVMQWRRETGDNEAPDGVELVALAETRY